MEDKSFDALQSLAPKLNDNLNEYPVVVAWLNLEGRVLVFGR